LTQLAAHTALASLTKTHLTSISLTRLTRLTQLAAATTPASPDSPDSPDQDGDALLVGLAVVARPERSRQGLAAQVEFESKN